MAMVGCLRSTLPLISKALTSDLISFRGSSLQRSLLCPTLTNPEVSASMKDLCYDKFGISKEKKDSKNVKGNRDLLDELPEKRRIEERGYLSDNGEEQSACYCSFYYCTCLVMAFYFTYWCKFALVYIWFGLLVLGWNAVAKGCCCNCWP